MHRFLFLVLITSLFQVSANSVTLAQDLSREILNIEEALTLGCTGEGQKVAIISGGILYDHEALGVSRVSDEACFGDNFANPPDFDYSICPGDATSTSDPGSGTYAGDWILIAASNGSNSANLSSTHMTALISADEFSFGGTNFNSVAPQSSLVSIAIGSLKDRSSGQFYGLNSMEDALQQLFSIASQGDLASIVVPQDFERALCWSSSASALQQLSTLEIPILIGSGESGLLDDVSTYCDGLTVVGATSNADMPIVNSNGSAELNFWAPGVAVVSAKVNPFDFGEIDQYWSRSGSELAAAFTAGAFAALRSHPSSPSFSRISTALERTSTDVTRNGITRGRIDIGEACRDLTRLPVELTDFMQSQKVQSSI